MPRETELDRRWRDLMGLCTKERDYRARNQHPRLLRHISQQIDELAVQMGFKEHHIKRREFRAEKDGEHILRLLVD